jgi:hypothetical protein
MYLTGGGEVSGMAAKAGVSAKVSNGTLGGGAAGIVSALLVYFIPAWHAGIPPELEPLIPAIVGAAGYYAAGWQSTHRATAAEISRAVKEARTVLATVTVPAADPPAAGGAP